MTEKDKYRAKIEAQMTSFNETIEGIDEDLPKAMAYFG
jgi:hypothetical protein